MKEWFAVLRSENVCWFQVTCLREQAARYRAWLPKQKAQTARPLPSRFVSDFQTVPHS